MHLDIASYRGDIFTSQSVLHAYTTHGLLCLHRFVGEGSSDGDDAFDDMEDDLLPGEGRRRGPGARGAGGARRTAMADGVFVQAPGTAGRERGRGRGSKAPRRRRSVLGGVMGRGQSQPKPAGSVPRDAVSSDGPAAGAESESDDDLMAPRARPEVGTEGGTEGSVATAAATPAPPVTTFGIGITSRGAVTAAPAPAPRKFALSQSARDRIRAAMARNQR